MRDSIFMGVGAGAAGGFLLGPSVVPNRSEAKLGGVLVGAALGGISAYFIQKGIEDRDARVRKETIFNLDKYNVSRPTGNLDAEYGIASPSVETECFDTEIKGDKLIQAHCESRISGTPEWVKASAQKKRATND